MAKGDQTGGTTSDESAREFGSVGVPQTPDPRVTELEEKLAGSLGTVVFRGYLGTPSRTGFLRLYLTLELDEFVEIADGDRLHNVTLEDEEQPLPETVVWVKGNARVEITRTDRREVQADFLKGDIASGADYAEYGEALYRKRTSSLCAVPAWTSCCTVATSTRACCDKVTSSTCTLRC